MTMGTWFSDKYAEGTIGHRFYAGCQNVDTVEALAAEHARELFGAEYAYAQPHSGIDANLVAFWAILATRVEAPALESAGRQERQRPVRGRLGEAARTSTATSGCSACRSTPAVTSRTASGPTSRGKMFHQRSYGTDPETQLLDYDQVARDGPRVQAAGADRRLLGVPASGELRQDARDRRRGRCDLDGRHGALRRSGRRQGLHRRRGPDPACPHRHHDHPQVAARTARRAGADELRSTPTPSTVAARWCSAARCRT